MKSEKQMRILAVDNEIHMLKLLERIISEKTPYLIETTNNVLEVPELIKENTFDLIISDLKMPGMDGLGLLQYVMDSGGGEEFIIITAFGSFDTANKALEGGAFDYITKPFRKEQIIAAVNRVMKFKTAQKELNKIIEIFKSRPFESAQVEFESQYIKRLFDECEGDIEMVTKLSGIAKEKVDELIGENE